jgi:hypothetical protein
LLLYDLWLYEAQLHISLSFVIMIMILEKDW